MTKFLRLFTEFRNLELYYLNLKEANKRLMQELSEAEAKIAGMRPKKTAGPRDKFGRFVSKASI